MCKETIISQNRHKYQPGQKGISNPKSQPTPNPGLWAKPMATLSNRIDNHRGPCNKRNKNRAWRRLRKTIHCLKCCGDVPTEVKEIMIVGLQSQLKKYQQNRPVTTYPIHLQPGASSKNGLTSNRGNRPTRKDGVRIGRSKYRLVHQIARGRRYGVVSHSSKHHGLRPNIRGPLPKEKESYRDNGYFEYHKVFTHSLPPVHEANNDTDDSRHVVSPPVDGVLFDIRRSGAFYSLWPSWETEAETIQLDSGYYIEVPKDITLGRPPRGKASQNNLGKRRQRRKVTTSKDQ